MIPASRQLLEALEKDLSATTDIIFALRLAAEVRRQESCWARAPSY